jgi:hypothetical protein
LFSWNQLTVSPGKTSRTGAHEAAPLTLNAARRFALISSGVSGTLGGTGSRTFPSTTRNNAGPDEDSNRTAVSHNASRSSTLVAHRYPVASASAHQSTALDNVGCPPVDS